jgi:hypothetical protein
VILPSRLVVALLLMLSVAATSARSLPYTGSLDLALGSLDPFELPGSGEGGSTSGAVRIGPGANFTTTTSVPITAPFPIVDVRLGVPAGLTAALFEAGAAPGGGLGGDAPLKGSVRLGLLGPPPFAFLTVPLSPIGVEGARAAASSPIGVTVTVVGRAWTTGSVQLLGTAGPFAGQLLGQAQGTDTRSAGGAGSIVLVTPTLIRTNIAGSENIPLISVLTVNFVPEPATLLLVGSGLAGLTALSRRRRARD